jgi:hypothetical protein
MKNGIVVTVTAAIVALVLAGCAPPGDAKGEDAPTDAVAEESAQDAGIDLTNLGDPIAVGEIPAFVKSDPDATMTVEFYGLKRSGETVVGTYAFRVDSDADDEAHSLFSYLSESEWDPCLIDPENLNKHAVLRTDNGAEAKSRDSLGTDFAPGQTFYAYASFAAPPQSVKTMDVADVEGMPLVTGVKIQ